MRQMWMLLPVGLGFFASSWAPVQAQAKRVATKSKVSTPVSSYKVSSSFREVANYKTFKKKVPLRSEHERLLVKNLFASTPSDSRQLFHIYEHNDYHNLPSFVTTDTVLQLYHIFFDFTLRTAEVQTMLPVLKRLTTGMLRESVTTWQESTDPDIKVAALKNVAYFGVANRQLGLSDAIPSEALELVRGELALIAKHQGFSESPIFPYKIDYSQFIPRGHYTRSTDLRKFFGVMMWYGLVPFSLHTHDGEKPELNEEQIRQGLLWVQSLYTSGLSADWSTIYEPTTFFVGFADDLTPAEWKRASDAVYGNTSDTAAFADTAKLQQFAIEIQKARAAKIEPRYGRTMGVPAGTPNMIEGPLSTGQQLRFMGQRYIPDSEILQRLSVPIKRVFPSGLDVMAVMGSKRAADILDAYPQIYNAAKWPGYKTERAKLTAEFARVPREKWLSNLYWGWLYALRALNEPQAANLPSFMRNTAWQDKSLYTALASWSQLRHDTILYGKQSVVQCGGDDVEPPFVKGYVEPNVVFYDRLLWLTKASREGLEKRKLLPLDLKGRFEQFEDLMVFLRRVSAKQLRGEKLTRDEYLEIRYIGGKIEHLTTSVMEGGRGSWELLSETDKDMAVIADVHTGGTEVLEEAVGHAYEIYAIVPIEGKLTLTRGAIFSYYEFKQPISQRLTDEAWQALLKAGKTPAAPVWTKSFVVPGKRRLNPSEFAGYSSGC